MERFRGRADLALDDAGKAQARAAGLSLAGLSASAIFASPLQRTMETANILSEHIGAPVEPCEGLTDIDYGDWQGLSPAEAAARDERLYAAWLEKPHLVRFPNGESLDDVRARVTQAIEQVSDAHSGGTVVLVSHKVVCQVALCALLGLDNSHFWQVRQDVCAFNAFEIENGVATVTLVNDTCHLKDKRLETKDKR